MAGSGFNRRPAIGAEVLKLISAKRSLQLAAAGRCSSLRAKPSPVRKELSRSGASPFQFAEGLAAMNLPNRGVFWKAFRSRLSESVARRRVWMRNVVLEENREEEVQLFLRDESVYSILI
jgi:hypothetical protein